MVVRCRVGSLVDAGGGSYFFFQAEDGIRDRLVTGVQTCALPISLHLLPGNYKVIFRAKSAKQYMYTTEKKFKVRSGKSELIKLY